MKLLALDTATSATVVGVLAGDAVHEARDDPAPGERPRHAQQVLALAEAALGAAGIGWAELDRLAVGAGPGGFTGLRIGVASARALAQAHGLPLAAVSTLRALALGTSWEAPVVATVDARRGEVFAAAWDDAGAQWLPAAAYAPEALAARLADAGERFVCVGEGAVRHRAALEGVAIVPPDAFSAHRLQAAALCRLGAEATPVALHAVVPDYVREPDAKVGAA